MNKLLSNNLLSKADWLHSIINQPIKSCIWSIYRKHECFMKTSWSRLKI